MIKWFCDVCGDEILVDMLPIRVRAYRCVKGRDDPDVGWGHSVDIVNVFCHIKCADVLQNELEVATVRARIAARNNV